MQLPSPDQLPSPEQIAVLLLHGLISILSGFASAMSKKEKTVFDFIAQVVISGFTGTIAGMLAMYFWGASYMTFALSGIFGFMGKEGMYWIIRGTKKAVASYLNISEKNIDK